MEETYEKKKIEHPKPVAVGEIIQVTIDSQGVHNEGIARRDGFMIFVKGAVRGESCKAKVIEVKRTYAVAEKL